LGLERKKNKKRKRKKKKKKKRKKKKGELGPSRERHHQGGRSPSKEGVLCFVD
jgi:hypothetical protein